MNLYRKAVCCVTLLALLCPPPGLGQRGRKVRGPRAVAVLELYKDPQGTVTRTRLIPVAIQVEGKFYDAGLYDARPRPMALESGTVYEVEHTGESLGLFTVTSALQTNRGWLGQGKWEPRGKAGSSEKTRSADDDEPPILRRDDPPKPAQTPGTESPASDDPDRPVLRRGKPANVESEPDATEPSSPPAELVPAVSDASGPDPLSYKFYFGPGEEQSLRKAMEQLARTEVILRTTPSTGHLPKQAPVQFEDVQFRAFDLDTNNAAELVFTARSRPVEAPPRGRPGTTFRNSSLYVTVVARVDINGVPRELYSDVSRATGDGPRLQLIDAVDADGDGDGELLFRRIGGENAGTFVLFRASIERLVMLLDTAGR